MADPHFSGICARNELGIIGVCVYIYLFPVPGSVAPHHPPNGMVPPHYPPKKTLCMLFAAFQSYGLPFACYLHAICSIPKPHLFVAFNSHTLPTKYLGTTNYVLPACCLHIIYMHIFSSYTTNNVYVITLFIYILPIACLYATYIPLTAYLH